MEYSNLPEPTRYKNWLIWPKVILDFIDVVGCSDTIDGMCTVGKTVQECIDSCVRGCGAGYHVQFDNGNSICVPILTSIHPNLNPSYRLSRQEKYPNLEHVTITTFINVDQYPFPPNHGNSVFVKDILTISQYDKPNETVGTMDSSSGIYMADNNTHDDNIQLILAEKTVENFSYYVPLEYGDRVMLVIPGTSMIATVDNHDNYIFWKFQNTVSGLPNSIFKITCVNPEKKDGDIVSYGDPIILSYHSDSNFVVKDPKYSALTVKYENINNIRTNSNAIFTFSSKMVGFYCQDNECKSVPIKNIEKDGTYNGAMVYRKNRCWGICGKDTLRLQAQKVGTGRSIILVITVSVIAILVIFMGFRLYSKKTY